MKKAFIVVPMFLGATLADAQNVAFVNDKPINGKEFLWVYKKNNNGNAAPSFKNLSDYLQLYIDFKLKVAEAKSQQLDLDTAYRSEVDGYESALRDQKKISPKSAEYSYIVNEYREGVLMFNVSEKEIWGRLQDDEAELIDFYTAHKEHYKDKAFADVRGDVIADYQQALEKEWITKLRNKYSVKVDTSVLKKLAKR